MQRIISGKAKLCVNYVYAQNSMQGFLRGRLHGARPENVTQNTQNFKREIKKDNNINKLVYIYDVCMCVGVSCFFYKYIYSIYICAQNFSCT